MQICRWSFKQSSFTSFFFFFFRLLFLGCLNERKCIKLFLKFEVLVRMCVCCVTVANAGVLLFVLFLLFWAALLSRAWRDVIFIKQFGNALPESSLSAWLIPANPASCREGKSLMKSNNLLCLFVYLLRV